MPPFARPGPSGWFPGFFALTAALRLLRAPWSLGFSLRFQVPVPSGDVQISQVPRLETPGLRPCVEPAVQPGLQARSLRNWQRSVQLKTRLTGTCAVWLPNVGVAAGSRTFLPQARFQLEETTGKVRPQLRVPLSDVTTTQIEVLSVFPVVLQPEAAQ